MIVPALNEEKYILNTLRGLQEQSFKDFEVIVCDGNSRDRTREIARKYARVVIEKKRGMAAGRNGGAKYAKGEILVFLDADTKPCKDLLQIYSTAFKDGTIAATGPIYPLEKNTSWDLLLGFRFVSIIFVKLSIIFGSPSIVGSNFAIRRDIFRKVHGFDSSIRSYEDWDLSMRLKKYGRIKYIYDAYVYTSVRRVVAWGMWGFFAWHVENIIRYNILKKPKGDYPAVR